MLGTCRKSIGPRIQGLRQRHALASSQSFRAEGPDVVRSALMATRLSAEDPKPVFEDDAAPRISGRPWRVFGPGPMTAVGAVPDVVQGSDVPTRPLPAVNPDLVIEDRR